MANKLSNSLSAKRVRIQMTRREDLCREVEEAAAKVPIIRCVDLKFRTKEGK